jgi:sister-chromatid-cohesion protein PDS5
LFLCSEVDKAHLRLAAAKGILRLARRWDTQIPVDIFQMVLLVLQVCCSENLFAA